MKRAMTKVLENLIGKMFYVYIDLILDFEKTRYEHKFNFEKILNRIKENGFD